MHTFTRRTYGSPGEFLGDVRTLLSRREVLKTAMRGELISPAFRERLMMVVTQVNNCRYCRYYHSREALRTGVSNGELQDLLDGDLPQESPEEELPALAYAQHWAEQNGAPDPQAQGKIETIYGQERARAIEVVLRMIRIGNLSGNTWDYLLYRLSFGRWGQP